MCLINFTANTFIGAVFSVVYIHLKIILIRKFQSSKMDFLLSNSSRATKRKSLISIQLINVERKRKISGSARGKKHTKAWLIRVHRIKSSSLQ